MAKKKKKTPTNPARGFATTSVASKPKAEKESDKTEAEKDDVENDEAPAVRGFKLQDSTHGLATKSSSTSAKQQHELTPQELEEQLEQDDLQLFVEKHAAKIARDAARQIARVQTDCRVLRAQSQYLAADQWLPDELVQEILDFSRRELREEDHTENAPSSKLFSEEITVARLWSLQLTLLNLRVPKTRIFELFTALLSQDPKPDSGSFVWGFRESLDLLSLDEGDSSLPAYDGQRGPSEIETGNTIIEGKKHQAGLHFASPSSLQCFDFKIVFVVYLPTSTK
jgi:ATP-dependent RNA helicase DHX29